MPALNFKVFIDQVEDGRKTQTIRRPRKRPILPGFMLHLWTGLRTKGARKLGEAVCTHVIPVRLDGWPSAGEPLTRVADEEAFAQADGFEGWVEMREWFRSHYGLPFEGFAICWGAEPPVWASREALVAASDPASTSLTPEEAAATLHVLKANLRCEVIDPLDLPRGVGEAMVKLRRLSNGTQPVIAPDDKFESLATGAMRWWGPGRGEKT